MAKAKAKVDWRKRAVKATEQNGEGYEEARYYKAEIAALELKVKQLRKAEADEAAEFNAGYEARNAGVAYEDAPRHTDYDAWRVGWAWAAFDDLRRQVADLEFRCAKQAQTAERETK